MFHNEIGLGVKLDWISAKKYSWKAKVHVGGFINFTFGCHKWCSYSILFKFSHLPFFLGPVISVMILSFSASFTFKIPELVWTTTRVVIAIYTIPKSFYLVLLMM